MPYGMSSEFVVVVVLYLNGPEKDCLLCQWGGFVLYRGARGTLIQYLICKKIKAPKVEIDRNCDVLPIEYDLLIVMFFNINIMITFFFFF